MMRLSVPLFRFESIQTVISLAAQHKLMVHHLDVATEFLNGELQEEVYIKKPEGFVVKGKENMVCKVSTDFVNHPDAGTLH